MKNIISLSVSMLILINSFAQIIPNKMIRKSLPEKSFNATRCSPEEALQQVGGPNIISDPKLTFQVCIKTGTGFSDNADPKLANHLAGFIKVYNHQILKYQVEVYYFWKGNQINTTLQTIKPNSAVILNFEMTAIKGKEGENPSVEVRSEHTLLKPNVVPPKINTTGGVYVAGFDTEENAEKGFNYYTAKYWKNGVPASFTEKDARVNAILVNGNDIYVAGSKETASGAEHATYWKNGIAVSLPASNLTNSNVSSMVANGTDIYLAGTAGGVAVYWKNGTLTKLSNSFSAATAITVNVADVFIAGNGTLGVPVLWKNGLEIPFSNIQYQRLNSITVYDNDVYAAGCRFSEGNVHSVARIWKNGISTDISFSNGRASANSIAVYQGDVYVAGYEENGSGGHTIAKYWKNGIPVALTNGNNDASANAILIIEGDVYIAGNDGETAKCWKNGTVTNLGTGTATSIFVK